ncbi:unnamed protein product [Oikopleura dioica]|uniref:TACO1/YebC-like second and third domain-containing protein n=1 Tax=Oikopleura dioica TaxID=34765 RepID=E4X300_OIKDI|nr:unnamed protein product [Oikopleura dioica]
MTETALAAKAGAKVLKKLNAHRSSMGKIASRQREQLRQRIRMVVTSNHPDKSALQNELVKEAKALNVPKDKLKLWLGADTKSLLVYFDGPGEIFAMAEIVDSKYDIGKAISILKPVFESKRLGLADKWSLNANQKRDTYLDYVGKVTITTELDEDEIMEVALELDVSDVKDRDCAFEFIVPARDTSNLLAELEKQSKISVQNSELTYLAATPIEIDDDDFEAVDLFEEKLTVLLSSNDFAMELGNIYYNFEINE